MSFWSKLFGGGGSNSEDGPQKPVSETEHEGFKISVTPQKEGGQLRLCGIISKIIDGEEKTHHLIRADLFTSQEDCVDATIRKAKQVIKEQGDSMFAP